MICTVCQLRMDPVLPLHGYTTHPCCKPQEISPQWEPGDRPKPHAAPTGIAAGAGQKKGTGRTETVRPVPSHAVQGVPAGK